jgi:hypothetical protein
MWLEGHVNDANWCNKTEEVGVDAQVPQLYALAQRFRRKTEELE